MHTCYVYVLLFTTRGTNGGRFFVFLFPSSLAGRRCAITIRRSAGFIGTHHELRSSAAIDSVGIAANIRVLLTEPIYFFWRDSIYRRWVFCGDSFGWPIDQKLQAVHSQGTVKAICAHRAVSPAKKEIEITLSKIVDSLAERV